MPTYDYQCNDCNHTFEAFQSITADPLAKCPQCGQRALERLISAGAGIIFKGSGFYETDYRKGSSGGSGSGESDGGADSDGGESD
jgi:putative FmdB family regulatory protein